MHRAGSLINTINLKFYFVDAKYFLLHRVTLVAIDIIAAFISTAPGLPVAF